jgi:hypothetical protein
MLSWVVTFRRALRRTAKSHSLYVLPHSVRAAFPPSGCLSLTVPSKSFPLNLFADPHHLTRVPSIFYKNIGGWAARYRNPHRPLVTRRCIQVLSFHILVHSFAACKIVSRLFSKASSLFAKNHPGWGEGVFLFSTFRRLNVQTIRPSHCSARTLVPQLAKAREIFAARGNNSAPPGV